jgi:hypothetical protein
MSMCRCPFTWMAGIGRLSILSLRPTMMSEGSRPQLVEGPVRGQFSDFTVPVALFRLGPLSGRNMRRRSLPVGAISGSPANTV